MVYRDVPTEADDNFNYTIYHEDNFEGDCRQFYKKSKYKIPLKK